MPGLRTATPSLVDGIRESAEGGGSAAAAARGYLAEHRGRYRIPDPGRDLRTSRTLRDGASETVRLQQFHRGVEVLGGQYVVRMRHKGGERVVTGTSGKYFTELDTGVEPRVSEAVAVERAVEAVTDQVLEDSPGTRPTSAPVRGGAEPAPLTGTDLGLVILPRGHGVLTRHVTVHGTHPFTGEPVLREVYVDARAGYPLLQYSGIKTFTAQQSTARPAPVRAPAEATGDPVSTRGWVPDGPPVTGSGTTLGGRNVELQVMLDETTGRYVMRDRVRMQGSSGAPLSTWDARGKSLDEVTGWPGDLDEFVSPTPQYGAEATAAGAVDAHWGAAAVYDYYRRSHGRDSLDGHGMEIDSLVGVTIYGTPYANAFWDGTKMVYGSGDEEYLPFSAGLDVVGHEMTHGVVENSANLVYAGQSGAVNEAIADYFGNAIDADTRGIPMDDPDSGLLGETLCRTKSPRECAVRDLNDGRTASKSFLGVQIGTDNGGVHLNSTIFGGALWDMRTDIGGTLADAAVYRALTQYMTPLDGFTEGRAAILAAARDLGADAAALRRHPPRLQRPRHRPRLGTGHRHGLRPAAGRTQHRRRQGGRGRRLVGDLQVRRGRRRGVLGVGRARRRQGFAQADQPQRRPLPRPPGHRRQDGGVAGVQPQVRGGPGAAHRRRPDQAAGVRPGRRCRAAGRGRRGGVGVPRAGQQAVRDVHADARRVPDPRRRGLERDVGRAVDRERQDRVHHLPPRR